MALRTPLVILAGIVTVCYPVIVYLGTKSLAPATLALALLCLVVVRLLLSGDWRQPRHYPLPALLGALCLAAAYLNSAQALKYYPVLMNLAVAAAFAHSLGSDQSLIEQFAGRFSDLRSKPPEARLYMRRLTAVWAALLCANGAVAAYTACCMSTEAWALYNSLVAYLVLGLFMVAEWGFRHYFRRTLARRREQRASQ